MTSRDQLHKWAAYLLGLLPIWLLDAFILPRYPVLGLTPVLLPGRASGCSWGCCGPCLTPACPRP